MATEAQRQAVKRYDEKNTVQIKIKLNYNTDAELIEKLESVGNKQGYIKKLIFDDIHKNDRP